MTEPLETTGVRSYLLPNEEVRLACQTRSGFLILTSRRVVILKHRGQGEYLVERAIPYDCVVSFEPKKDKFVITGLALDNRGYHTKETVLIEFKEPRVEKGEKKAEVKSSFQSIMNQCIDIIVETGGSMRGSARPLDYSYLDQLPESLTHNSILDLNTVLRDQPVHDELVHEAAKYLGDEPFLIEESLRDGSDNKSGVLFAAGTQGYFWIQGRKDGRFMQNVIVDTIEWENIRCFAYPWQLDSSIIQATYSLTKGGKTVRCQYLWKPPIDDATCQYPWLLQPANGPWILADISYRYSGKPLPASMDKQRFYH